jgi:hypothetical protein
MFGKRRNTSRRGGRRTAAETLEYLHPELRRTLARLHGAPPSVAEATIQLLPFGSRASLESLEPALVVAGAAVDDEMHRRLTLTPFAYEVMAEAAACDEADPRAVSEWSERARLAARASASGER